jgi:hypothetical protein
MLALLLALPALQAEDKPVDKPKSPKEQYDTLVKEFTSQQRDIIVQFRKTKGEEQQKLLAKYEGLGTDFAAKFFKLAEDNPKDPIAADALFWVLQNGVNSPVHGKAAEKATSLVAEMPLKDLARHVNAMRFGADGIFEAAFKRAEKELKDPNLGLLLTAIAVNGSHLPVGQKAVELLIERFPDHSGLESVCGALSRGRDPKSAETLKVILEKSPQKRVKAAAAMALGSSLASQVDQLGDDLAKADKVAAEAEKYFVMVIDQFGKENPAQATNAERDLKALRSLRVGKEALNISAVDLDEKEFKLSDYRGKVVLLDFWGNW